MDCIKIGIIDDHKIVRQGLKELLEKLDNFKVIIEFESGFEFLNALPLNEEPDIYILDYSLGDTNAIEVLKKLEKLPEERKVMVLTQHFEEDIINEAYKHGARGFLNKNCNATELKEVVNGIVKDGYYNVIDILKRVKNYDSKSKENLGGIALDITDKELEFLTYVCDEKEFSYTKIAEFMGVTERTVDWYRTSLFTRFNIKSKTGLLLFSYKYRLTKPFI